MSNLTETIDHIMDKVGKHLMSSDAYSEDDLKQEVALKILEIGHHHDFPYMVRCAINAIKSYKFRNRLGYNVPSGSMTYIKEQGVDTPQTVRITKNNLHYLVDPANTTHRFSHDSPFGKFETIDIEDIVSKDTTAYLYFFCGKSYMEICSETGQCLSQVSNRVNQVRGEILEYMLK